MQKRLKNTALNGHQHFDITHLVMQQRALSVFKKGPH